jgi:hypothetical protein
MAEALRSGGARCQRKTAPDPLRWIQRRLFTRSAPDEDKMTKRSPLDFPVVSPPDLFGNRELLLDVPLPNRTFFLLGLCRASQDTCLHIHHHFLDGQLV